jgi:hypothetical protein
MTSYWGPLGWMTLHSASMLYAEQPELAEIQVMRRFIDLFGDTISCHHCKSHFLSMKKRYEAWNPGYLSSRRELMLFVFRAHNTVNKRIDKPILQNVADCLTALKNANSYSDLASVRESYMTYLQRNWGRDFTADGISTRKKAHELVRINNEYLNTRTIDWTYTFEDNVLFLIEDATPVFVVRKRIGGFKNGKLII